jgi:hypothetical protein
MKNPASAGFFLPRDICFCLDRAYGESTVLVAEFYDCSSNAVAALPRGRAWPVDIDARRLRGWWYTARPRRAATIPTLPACRGSCVVAQRDPYQITGMRHCVRRRDRVVMDVQAATNCAKYFILTSVRKIGGRTHRCVGMRRGSSPSRGLVARQRALTTVGILSGKQVPCWALGPVRVHNQIRRHLYLCHAEHRPRHFTRYHRRHQ